MTTRPEISTPVIETMRLVLRPFAARHLTKRCVAWLNEPNTVRFSELRHSEHTIESCRQHWEGLKAAGHDFWAVERRDTGGRHIGNVTAYHDRANRVVELSILIGEAGSRSNHYGEEAWCAAVDHLLNVMRVRRVEAGTMATNHAMLRLFEKSGMAQEGRRTARFLLDGVSVDLVEAGRIAEPVVYAEG